MGRIGHPKKGSFPRSLEEDFEDRFEEYYGAKAE
jgi:hypothetical protein